MVLTKYHRDEFPDTRKTFEAVHPPKREAPFRAAYTGVAADVLPWLRTQNEVDTTPLTLTDWSARIAADFGAVDTALGWLASHTQACIEQAAWSEFYRWHGLHEACVVAKAELAEPAPDTSWGTHAEQLGGAL